MNLKVSKKMMTGEEKKDENHVTETTESRIRWAPDILKQSNGSEIEC